MTTQDQQLFLSNLGIQLDQQHHSHVADTAVEPADNLITVLSHYGFLAINGPDSATFLQGQTTCNLNEVSPLQSRAGAYCTPKGRMLSSFHIASLDLEQYLLRMRRPLVENTRTVLAKYIVFSKAEQTNASDDYLAIGLHGDMAKTAINNSFGACPNGQHKTLTSAGNIVIQLDQTGQNFECWLRTEQLATLWPKLSEGLELQGSQSWELLAIRRGEGEVTAATIEAFTPQMLNYQLTGAVSFNKGCYTGQEVVARLHYKAKLKRQMYRIRLDAAPLQPGQPLYRDSGEQSIGDIVNAVSLNNNQTEALATISVKEVGQKTLFVDSNEVNFEVLSLPYAINNDAPQK